MPGRNTLTQSKSPPPKRKPEPPPDQHKGERSMSWCVHVLVVIALLGCCLALYGGTFGLGFLTLDDPDYIQNNPFIANLNGAKLWHILSVPYFANYAPGHL